MSPTGSYGYSRDGGYGWSTGSTSLPTGGPIAPWDRYPYRSPSATSAPPELIVRRLVDMVEALEKRVRELEERLYDSDDARLDR